MLKTTIAVLTLGAAAVAASPAHAVHVDNVAGVLSCSATYLQDGVHRTCTFVTTPGTYLLEISNHGTYAWARVGCAVLGPVLPAEVATSGSYASRYVQLGGGLCTLEVAATGGTATGTVS